MSVSNAGFTDGSQTKAWEISCEKQKSYKCYGIKASAPIDPYWKLVSLANIQMYHSFADECEVKMQSSDLIKVSYSGKPGASTEWRDDHSAAHAFKPQTGWPWASKDLPATIWYNFNHSFRLAKISFTSRKSLWSQTPKTFEIVGSNDCSNWDVLTSVSNAGFIKGGQTKAWEISCEKQKLYKCYGIRASAAMDPNCKLVSLVNIQMYHLPGQ